MSGGTSTKKQSILDVLSSLAKSIPVIQLHRIETIYPVFEGKPICLSTGKSLVDHQWRHHIENDTASVKENEEETDDDEDDEDEEEENENNEDVQFEFEMDLECIPRDVTVKKEIVSDDEEVPDVMIKETCVDGERIKVEEQEVAIDDIGNTEAQPVSENVESNEQLETECESNTNSEAKSVTKSNLEPSCESREPAPEGGKEVLETSITKNGAKKRECSSDEIGIFTGDGSNLSEADAADSHGNQSASWASANSPIPETTNNSHSDHAKRRKYCCNECDQTFDIESAFISHDCGTAVETNTKSFICPKCEEVFADLGKLRQHIAQCWEGTLSCIICCKVFFGRFVLIKHLQMHKNSTAGARSTSGACLVCGLFDEGWNLAVHWRIHTGVKFLRCVVCKQLMDQESLIAHVHTHKVNDLFWCPHCEMMFRGKSLHMHHKSVHASKEPFHLCECCGVFFMDRTELEIHVLSHVDRNTVFKCTKCTSIYPFQKHFELHTKVCFKLNDITEKAESDLRKSVSKHLKIFKTFGLGWFPLPNRMPVCAMESGERSVAIINQVKEQRKSDNSDKIVILNKEIKEQYSVSAASYKTNVTSVNETKESNIDNVHRNSDEHLNIKKHLRMSPAVEEHNIAHLQDEIVVVKSSAQNKRDEKSVKETNVGNSEVVASSSEVSLTSTRSPPTTDPNLFMITEGNISLQKQVVPERSKVSSLCVDATSLRPQVLNKDTPLRTLLLPHNNDSTVTLVVDLRNYVGNTPMLTDAGSDQQPNAS